MKQFYLHSGFWKVFLTFFFSWAALSACIVGGENKDKTPAEFDGRGQGHVTSIAMVIEGEVQHKNFSGGEIFIEVRPTFTCAFGRCPVIGVDPLALERLSAPGPFNIHMSERTENLMIIASYFPNSGGVRIAHAMVPNGEEHVSALKLSLDRPWTPLR